MILCEGELPAVGSTLIVVLRVEADGQIRNVAWTMPAGTALEALSTPEGRRRYLTPALEALKP